MTEPELIALFEVHDRLVNACLAGDISLEQFVDHYDNFPEAFALEGHEWSEAEKAVLARHGDRLRFHLGVVECLRDFSREVDAQPEQPRAGRFGSAEGFRRLRHFHDRWTRGPETGTTPDAKERADVSFKDIDQRLDALFGDDKKGPGSAA